MCMESDGICNANVCADDNKLKNMNHLDKLDKIGDFTHNICMFQFAQVVREKVIPKHLAEGNIFTK